jgi:STE24 endopeptidase
MHETSPVIDPQRQERAHRYARARRLLWAAELALAALYFSLWIGLRLANRVAAVLPPALPWWAQALLMAAALALPWLLLTMPLSLFGSYILPHRYELSTQTLGGWFSDLAKQALLSAILGAPMLVGLYGLLRALPRLWWLAAAGASVALSAFFAVIAPVVLMPLFNRFVPLGEERADLVARLTTLSERAGTKVRGVFTFDMSRRTRAANAALLGLGRTRRIILGDTLLSEFSEDEIEVVLAHELGHHAHHDVAVSLLGQGVLNVLMFLIAALVLQRAAPVLALRGIADAAGLPVLGLCLGIVSFLSTPLGNALSRWRESMADSFALQLTGKAQAFADAMTRLANQNLGRTNPPRWEVLLFFTHPPLGERIRKAQALLPVAETPAAAPPSHA